MKKSNKSNNKPIITWQPMQSKMSFAANLCIQNRINSGEKYD